MSGRKTVSDMTLEEVRAERIRVTREYLDLLEEKERELVSAPAPTLPATEITPDDVRLVKWPLPDAMPVVLALSDEPQTAKEIVATLKRAGREFESDNPVRAVRAALKKAMATNHDVYTAGWAKYYLRSKSTRKTRQIEKAFAKTNGTGGRSTKEHGQRTAEGIAKRRSQGLEKWGRDKKATPEVVERAKEMMRGGMTLRETCRALGIAIPTLYQYGVRQRELKKEGQLRQKELALGDKTDGDNVVRFAKG
ncbi:hypothetical protein DW352_23840 [Pseudolabrys taiwanensis]|uniref:Helix-turn-helix domain-containing protein n=1 Tax=Pseudolabrys taiwanensis TaxID=331696 RepID=A0A346A286_9HYPH|nr:hypothetical protein [Pseudolabrys taiwanensis]AXK83283.1 hypothetical protein DW352_23840 [Pseudolabrys taiwanensis]